jgi:hypothetical protein
MITASAILVLRGFGCDTMECHRDVPVLKRKEAGNHKAISDES